VSGVLWCKEVAWRPLHSSAPHATKTTSTALTFPARIWLTALPLVRLLSTAYASFYTAAPPFCLRKAATTASMSVKSSTALRADASHLSLQVLLPVPPSCRRWHS